MLTQIYRHISHQISFYFTIETIAGGINLGLLGENLENGNIIKQLYTIEPCLEWKVPGCSGDVPGTLVHIVNGECLSALALLQLLLSGTH